MNFLFIFQNLIDFKIKYSYNKNYYKYNKFFNNNLF